MVRSNIDFCGPTWLASVPRRPVEDQGVWSRGVRNCSRTRSPSGAQPALACARACTRVAPGRAPGAFSAGLDIAATANALQRAGHEDEALRLLEDANGRATARVPAEMDKDRDSCRDRSRLSRQKQSELKKS